MNRLIHGHRSLVLLFTLLAVMLTAPLGEREGLAMLMYVAGVFLPGLAGAYLLMPDRRWFIVYLVVVLGSVVLESIAAQEAFQGALVLRSAAGCFTLATTGMLLAFVVNYSMLRDEATRRDRLLAGICGYLVLAFMWAGALSWIEAVGPGAFVDHADGVVERADLIYVSLVTLTTLGYGDVAPVGRIARVMCSLEAVCGTLYLAIFISSLIAKLKSPGK